MRACASFAMRSTNTLPRIIVLALQEGMRSGLSTFWHSNAFLSCNGSPYGGNAEVDECMCAQVAAAVPGSL